MTDALRAVYRYWIGIVFLAVIAQIAAAGYGAFYASDKLGDKDENTITEKVFENGFGFHIGFGYLIFLASVLLLLIALGARLGRPRIWWVLAVPVLVIVQIILAWAGEDVPFVGSFHPVNALIIAGLTGYLTGQEWRRRALVADTAGGVATDRR